MRMLNEQLATRTLDLMDGVKAYDERGWVQVLPDPDEPLVHLYAEGGTEELSDELAARSFARGRHRAGRRDRAANAAASLKLRLTPRPSRLLESTPRTRGVDGQWTRCPTGTSVSDDELEAMLRR